MAIQFWQHEEITSDAKELLVKLKGSIHSRVGPDLLVLGFTPQWISGGSYWVGRLDYMSHDAPKVYSVILEGTKDSLISSQPIGNRAVMVNYNGRSLIDIEFEGPGFRERVV